VQYTFVEPKPFINFSFLWSIVKGLFSFIFSISFLQLLYVLGVLIIIALITLVLFLIVRMYEIHQAEEKKKKPTVTPNKISSNTVGVEGALPAKSASNESWKHIREELLSSNSSDWKLAIIEADIYMDRVLDDQGFHGDTTSDKLKQVTPDKLGSISIAWEVHKIRNRIAHDGAAFVVTQPEARRILSYYEIIFTDLGVI
jgi:hypothetical protein